ncbi:type 1 glutamine amidotransferase-like domain-containing protein [bacterium]|nr:type 1 glutamine amidotransferase-like domain-containing protein [bacterium]
MSLHPPKPIFLFGGRTRGRTITHDPLLDAAFAASGVARPAVAYIGAASGDDHAFFMMLKQRFISSGARSVTLAATVPPEADIGTAREIIADADVVFLSGGDVDAGMRVIRERKLHAFLVDLHRRGTLFMGMSAGSIMLAKQWVRWPEDGGEDEAELFDCLGIAPVYCDMHAEEDGWEELKALLKKLRHDALGYGVPSGGGMIVHPDGEVEALGLPVHRIHRTGATLHTLKPLAPARNTVR